MAMNSNTTLVGTGGVGIINNSNTTQMTTWLTTWDSVQYNMSAPYTTSSTMMTNDSLGTVDGNATTTTDLKCQWNNAKTALEIVFLFTLVVNLYASSIIFSVPINKTKQYANVQFCLRVLNVFDVTQSILLAAMPLMPKEDCSWTGGVISCNAFGYLLTILLVLSPYVVTVMGFDRYMMVRRPLTAHTYMTQSTTAKIIIAVALFLMLQMSLPFFDFGQYILYKGRGLCVLDMYSIDTLSLVITGLYLGEGMLSVIMLLVWTIIIFVYLRKMKSRLSNEPSMRYRGGRRQGSNTRSFNRMTIAIVVLYIICYVPFLLRKLTEVTLGSHYVTHGPLATATFGLIFMNPLLNPIVYVAFNKKYRDRLKKMYCYTYSTKITNRHVSRETLGSKPSLASMSSSALSTSTTILSVADRNCPRSQACCKNGTQSNINVKTATTTV